MRITIARGNGPEDRLDQLNDGLVKRVSMDKSFSRICIAVVWRWMRMVLSMSLIESIID